MEGFNSGCDQIGSVTETALVVASTMCQRSGEPVRKIRGEKRV